VPKKIDEVYTETFEEGIYKLESNSEITLAEMDKCYDIFKNYVTHEEFSFKENLGAINNYIKDLERYTHTISVINKQNDNGINDLDFKKIPNQEAFNYKIDFNQTQIDKWYEKINMG